MSETMTALSSDLERLIDERLDAVDRILSLSRTARSERMQILSDLESQIRDRLAAKTSEEPTRADLLAVFSELDPPEAYLDEGFSKDPSFHVSRSLAQGTQHISSESLVTSLPASRREGGQLALWAGFMVSMGCILTACSILLVVVGPEAAILLTFALQLVILSGSFLAIVNLLQPGPTSGLNRLISWVCVGTIPWSVVFVIGWLSIMASSVAVPLQYICAYSISGGALIHGAWLGFFTIRYMLEQKRA